MDPLSLIGAASGGYISGKLIESGTAVYTNQCKSDAAVANLQAQ